MKSKIFITLIFVFANIFALSQSYKVRACENFFTEDETEWEQIIKAYTDNFEQDNLDSAIELLSFYYTYVSQLLHNEKFEKAEIYVVKGEKLVDKYLAKYPENATLNSFKGAFVGFYIDLDKMKVIYLASKSNGYVDKALKIDCENTQAIIDKGNILLHTPEIFGGDKQRAIEYYQKAVKIFNTTNNTKNNLMYLVALSDLRKAYIRTGQYKKADFVSNLLQMEKLKYK